MAKAVKRAQFHQSVFIEGIGNLGSQLPAVGKTIADLKMSTSEEGLVVEGKGQGGFRKAIIPYANVVIMELAQGE